MSEDSDGGLREERERRGRGSSSVGRPRPENKSKSKVASPQCTAEADTILLGHGQGQGGGGRRERVSVPVPSAAQIFAMLAKRRRDQSPSSSGSGTNNGGSESDDGISSAATLAVQMRNDSMTGSGDGGNGKAGITDSTSLLKELECSGCSSLVGASVHICEAGHLACDSCAGENSNSCKTCQGRFVPKNGVVRKLEAMISFLEVECSNGGCSSMNTLKTRKSHAQTCSFRPIRCFQQHASVCDGKRRKFQ